MANPCVPGGVFRGGSTVLRLAGGDADPPGLDTGELIEGYLRLVAIIVRESAALRELARRGTPSDMLRLATPPAGAIEPLTVALDEWDRDMGSRLGLSDVHRTKSRKAVEEFIAFSGWSGYAEFRSDGAAAKAVDWVNALIANGNPGARKTAKNKLSQLVQFAGFLQMTGRLKDQATGERWPNPFEDIKVPKASRRRQNAGARPFTWEQSQVLIDLAEKIEAGSANARKFGPLRSTFYRFLRATGLRYSEALRQKWEDIDIDAGAMILSGDKADRNDPLPLTVEAAAMLRSWREAAKAPTPKGARRRQEGFVFPCLPSHHTLDADIEAAGIPGRPEGKKGQWHRFRKTIGTHGCRQGVDIRVTQKILRHADIAVTARDYTHLELNEIRAGMDALANSGSSPLRNRGAVADTPGAEVEAPMVQATAKTHDAMRPAGSHSAADLSNSQVDHDRPARPHSAVGASVEAEQWSRGESTSRLRAGHRSQIAAGAEAGGPASLVDHLTPEERRRALLALIALLGFLIAVAAWAWSTPTAPPHHRITAPDRQLP